MRLPFHLCQPGPETSCGACCGLYNFRDHSRANVTAALRRRTVHLSTTPRTPEAFHAAAETLKAEATAVSEAPLFPIVRVCPMLGFLDAEERRVGCLAHPKVTGGPDLRDCGVYTSRICEDFECPSFLWLDAGQARLIRAACADWYLYGLVITDVEFVRGCLKLLAEALGGTPDPDTLASRPEVLAAIRALFALKEHAPDRGEHGAVFGRFDPDGHGEAALRTLDYPALQRHAAPEDDVVLCLGYTPADGPALDAARTTVRRHVEAVAATLTATAGSRSP